MTNKTIYTIKEFRDIFKVLPEHQTRVIAMLKTAIHKCAFHEVESFTFDLTSVRITMNEVDEEKGSKKKANAKPKRKTPEPKATQDVSQEETPINPEDV